jgi:hypothetical protein
MKKNIILLLAMILFLIFLMFFDFGPQGRVYDCGMAEWHPDIPNDVKEECRKMRREDLQRHQWQIERKTIST